MKKIEVTLPAFHVDVVADALSKEGVEDIAISEVLHSGAARARAYRGVTYTVDYSPQTIIEAVVNDSLVASTMNCIAAALRSGPSQEISISITPIDSVREIGGDAHDQAPIWNTGLRYRPVCDGNSGEAVSLGPLAARVGLERAHLG